MTVVVVAALGRWKYGRHGHWSSIRIFVSGLGYVTWVGT